MDTASQSDETPLATDWRAAASVEYRSKRADLTKKVDAAQKAEARARMRREEVEKELRDLDIGAKAFGIDGMWVDADGQVSIFEVKHHGGGGSSELTAREIILDALAEASPEGLKAKKLRSIVEDRLGREVHYKTPGMTLYRLAEAGVVRRDGINWYLAKLPDGDDDHTQASDEEEYEPEEWDRVDWDEIQAQEDRMTGG